MGGQRHPAAVLPYWQKIIRKGNNIQAFVSPNGTTWTPIGQVNAFSTAGTLYFGLAVNAHNNSTLNTSTFTNVAMNADVPSNGVYRLVNRATGMSLDNLGLLTDGANVGLWASLDTNNQHWNITTNNGYSKLSSVTGGRFLDSGGATSNDTPVKQHSNSTSVNQQWSIISVGSGYYKIINLSNGRCLDSGGGTSNGTIAEFWGSGGSFNQQWSIVAP